MKAYPEYRNSGVEWTGDMPADWTTKKIKYFALENNTLFLDGDWIESKDIVSDNSQIRYITTGNIGEGKYKEQGLAYITEETFNKLNCTEVFPGDLIISRLNPPIGRCCIIPNLGSRIVTSVDNVILRPSPQYTREYLMYLMSNCKYYEYMSLIARGATMQRISRGLLGNVELPVTTNTTEQQSITTYLDRKTRQIDVLIDKKRRMIELLKEERTAIINHAVTKGLDPKVRMKDSGIEWVGEVPAHWAVKKTKYLFQLSVENAPDNNDFELLSLYTDIGVKPRKELEERGNRATTTDGYLIVKKGDIVVNKLLAWMGAIGCSDYDGVTSPAYDILSKVKPMNSKYYHHLFRCGLYLTEFKRRSRGIMDMRLRLYFDEFGQIPLPYPPPSEQDEIVSYLDSKTGQIDSLVAKEQTALNLVQEYRNALISEVVTGKIDVREVA